MATTYTDNLNLQQPDLDDDALITVINNDMAIIDQAVNGVQDGLAIVANGNTHVAISAGQFVYVRNHTTLTEGLYVASSNIAANATLSTSNLTADSAGGLNALNGKLTQFDNTYGPVDGTTEKAWIHSADYNNYKTSGVFPMGVNCLNAPNGNYEILEVTAPRQECIQQTAKKANGTFTREFRDNTWSSWEELALNSNLENKVPDSITELPNVGYLYKSGRIVCLLLNSWITVSNITIPSSFRPQLTAMLAGMVLQNGSAAIGRVSVNTDGSITCPDGQTQIWGCLTWLY